MSKSEEKEKSYPVAEKIEIGKRRFTLDLKSVVNRCYEIACETPEESFEKKEEKTK